jgi:hypothetical protein
MESSKITPQQRKEKSEKILESHVVPVNTELPVIESESEVNLRSQEEIVDRALCLSAVSLKGEGLEKGDVDDFIAKHAIKEKLSPAEKKFIDKEEVTHNDRIQFSWRYEALWVMLWALRYVDKLDYPSDICSPSDAIKTIVADGGDGFRENARLRDLSEILDEADLIYRYDWAVVDARINKKETPANLDPGVVQERHWALNWLIGYMDQKWDDISTDT